MTGAEIAIVVSSRDWAERLHRFVADHGGARVRARVLDGAEAVAEGYAVLVADDLTSFLTHRLVETLHRSGRRVLGVYDPVEPAGRNHLLELGVDDTITSLSAPEEFLAAIDGLALAAAADLDGELRDLVGPTEQALDAGAAAPGRGTVVAVGGPAGGPGATEVALGLSAAVARRGGSVALVDADDVAPSVAQRLGLPLHPNIRAVAEAVEHGADDLGDLVLEVDGIAVVPGLPSASDWAALRPGEVVNVVHDAAALADAVVVNVGHRLEDLAGPMTGQGRHRIAQAALSAADRVLAVAAPTPVGLRRLLDWIAEACAFTEAPVEVAFNRVPDDRFLQGELEAELRRNHSPTTVVFVPEDPRVHRAAWSGQQVAAGPFTRVLDGLAGALVDELPPVRQRRRIPWRPGR